MNSLNPEAARGDFDRVLALQPRNLGALANRAGVKGQLGDIDGALADCTSILEIDPQNAAALYNRSFLRAAACHWDAAIKDLD
jgi:lipoprotein NlpI